MRIDVALDHRDIDAELAGLYARMQRPADVLHGLPALATPLPGLVFRYREADGEFYIYVEDPSRGRLAGCTVFNRVFEVEQQVARHLRSPHSRYAQGYRRRGVATAVYQWALDSGMCLVSGPRQSVGAFRLWVSLAGRHELLVVHARDKRLRVVQERLDRSAFEAFDTRMLLLGAGWTAASFAAAAHREEAPARPEPAGSGFAIHLVAPSSRSRGDSPSQSPPP